jgi:PAS domain S-box-containing protein
MAPTDLWRDRPQRSAVRIALIYALIGAAWIAGSDWLFDLLIPDINLLMRIQTIKGVLYVAITSVVLWSLIRRDMQRLRHGEQRYRSLFEGSQDALLLLTLDGQFVDANRQVRLLTGYTADELKQFDRGSLLVNDVLDLLASCHTHLLDRDEPCSTVTRTLSTRNGSVPVELTVMPLDVNGTRMALFTMRDISRQQATQNALHHSEDRFRTFVEVAPIGIATSQGGITKYANPSYLRMFGYESVDELRDTSLLNQIAPECRDEIIERNRRRERGETVPDSYETTGLRADGSRFPLSIRVARIELDGPATLVFASDITERKQAEQALLESERKYRILFADNPYPMWVYDPQTLKFLEVNDTALQHYGYTRDEFATMTIRDIRPRHDVTGLETFVIQRRDKARLSSLWQHRKKNGEVIDVEITSHRLPYKDGEAALVLVNDITERRTAEHRLRQTEQHLRGVIEHAPVIMFACDANGLCTLLEGRGLRTIGLDAGLVVGRPVGELFVTYPLLLEITQAALDGHTRTTISELRGKYFETALAPIRDERGTVTGAIGIAHDVTERHLAEARLREIEARQQAILDGTTDAISLKDLDGRILLINRAGAAAVGSTPQELIGRFEWELLPAATARQARLIDEQIIATGTPQEIEQATIANGQQLTWLSLKTPHYTGDGRVQGVITISRDITERKRIEQALRKSEATNRALLHALPDLIFRLSTDGVFLDWIPGKDTGLLLPPEQFLGKRLVDVLPPPVAAQTLAAIEHARASGDIGVFEYQLPLPQGGVGEYEARLVLSVEHEVIAIVRDITERKRLERRLTAARDVYVTLVEEAPMLVWRTEVQGQCDFVNRQWTAFTGLTPAQSAGLGWTNAIHPDDREAMVDGVRAAFFTRSTFETEFRMLRHDGAERWMVTRGNPFFDSEGNFGGYIGTCTDIHERKRQEQIKDDFLALASHELKTPLAAMLGYVHLLQRWNGRSGYAQRADEALTAMIGEGARLDRLINDLLDVSRIQTGRLKVTVRAVDLAQIVAQTIASVQLTLPQHLLRFQSPALPVVVRADPHRIEQVLTNLLTNAAKYSPAAAPIDVELAINGPYAEIAVRDYGIGIPQADLPHIFDRFYQVQRPPRESRPGLGLGLFITHELVRQHGGAIVVQSQELRGSEFVVRLPYTTNVGEERTIDTGDNVQTTA